MERSAHCPRGQKQTAPPERMTMAGESKTATVPGASRRIIRPAATFINYNPYIYYPKEISLTLSTLLLVPLEDTVVFPHMTVTLPVDVGEEDQVLLVPMHENNYASVGTVGEVVDRVRLPGGGHAVVVNGLHRGVLGAAAGDPFGRLRVQVEERPDDHPRTGRVQ